MSPSDLIVGGVSAAVGVVATGLFNYLRNRGQDANSLTISMWTQVSKEQQEWRDQLRKDNERLELEVEAVRLQNAEFRGLMAELRVENNELRGELEDVRQTNRVLAGDNERLTQRVRLLEQTLQHNNTPVPGL